MDDITFNCSVCSTSLIIARAGAGQFIVCPNCSNQILVPTAGATLAASVIPSLPTPLLVEAKSRAPSSQAREGQTKTGGNRIFIIWCLGILATVSALSAIYGPTVYKKFSERVEEERLNGIVYVGPGSKKWKEDHPALIPAVLSSSDDKTPTGSPSTSNGERQFDNHALTKAEWKRRLGPMYLATGVLGRGVKKEAFTRLFGRPDRTETIGDDTYWYYECSDGTIQLVLDSGYAGLGVVFIKQTNNF